MAPIPGVTLPTPYGGKFRQIMVDLDPGALNAHGISPNDVLNAVNPQGLTLPSGDAKLGDKQFIVRVNAVAPSIEALNHLPIKQVGGATVYLSDVAHVRDAWAVQANVVRAEGKRSVLLTIIKNGDASTLDVVNRIKAALPEIKRAAPPGMDIRLLFDQSIFVQSAITGVLREGAIAAGLTALMILIFLGSWRSTLVVTVSSPLQAIRGIAGFTEVGRRRDRKMVEKLRERKVIRRPEDLGINPLDAHRSLLAARSFEDLMHWSGNLYDPPNKFRNW